MAFSTIWHARSKKCTELTALVLNQLLSRLIQLFSRSQRSSHLLRESNHRASVSDVHIWVQPYMQTTSYLSTIHWMCCHPRWGDKSILSQNITETKSWEIWDILAETYPQL